MSESGLLRNLRVASPCHESWYRMAGDERVRHCDSCQLNVYNFSEMTSREIESLVLKTEGRVCARMYRRPDGTVITRDCPVGLRAVRMRVAKFAGAACAAIFSFLSMVSPQTRQNQVHQTIRIQEITAQRPNKSGTLTGTVVDSQGAVIAGAPISLKRKLTGLVQTTKTDEFGSFSVSNLIDDEYSITIAVPGYWTRVFEGVVLKSTEAYEVNIMLPQEDVILLTGAVAVVEELPLPALNNGTMITDPNALKKIRTKH